MSDAPLTADELDELERLEAVATPGEWLKPFEDGALTADGEASLLALDKDGMAIVDRPEDAALIAAARNALPRLIAMARDNIDFSQRIAAQDHRIDDLERVTKAECEKARAERDGYLAALKAEALTHAQVAANRAVRDWYEFRSGDYRIGGITFRVTRNDDGELVAEEVPQ